MNNKSTFLQDNIIYILIPIIVFVVGAYFSYEKVNLMLDNRDILEGKKVERADKETKFQQLKANKERQEQR